MTLAQDHCHAYFKFGVRRQSGPDIVVGKFIGMCSSYHEHTLDNTSLALALALLSVDGGIRMAAADTRVIV